MIFALCIKLTGKTNKAEQAKAIVFVGIKVPFDISC